MNINFFTISRRSHPAQFWWLRTLRTIFLSLRTRGNVISKGRKRGVHCLPLRIIPCLCPLERDGERERKRVPCSSAWKGTTVRSTSNCSYKITGLRL